MPALAKLLGQAAAEPPNVRPRVTSAPVCGACGQRLPPPAVVFRDGGEGR
jgi:hypothetical protein